MNAIDTLLQNVQTFYDGLTNGTYLSEIIKDNETWICEMNTQNQLFREGVNAVGVDIMSYMPYRPLTIEIKSVKGQPTDRVTLRDTGDFYRGFYVETTDHSFYISSHDDKAEELAIKYGENIFGLTDKNAEELTHEFIYPDLLKKAHEVILK